MIVCICNNINSEMINASIDAGANTIDAVREQTGATDCCGKCQFKVNRMLHERETNAMQLIRCVAEG